MIILIAFRCTNSGESLVVESKLENLCKPTDKEESLEDGWVTVRVNNTLCSLHASNLLSN